MCGNPLCLQQASCGASKGTFCCHPAAKFADGSAPEAKRLRASYTEKTAGYQLKQHNINGDQARPAVFPPNTYRISSIVEFPQRAWGTLDLRGMLWWFRHI